jgi:hypothetical protein
MQLIRTFEADEGKYNDLYQSIKPFWYVCTPVYSALSKKWKFTGVSKRALKLLEPAKQQLIMQQFSFVNKEKEGSGSSSPFRYSEPTEKAIKKQVEKMDEAAAKEDLADDYYYR